MAITHAAVDTPSASIRIGDLVLADDGPVGCVEDMLVTETEQPRFLVVAVRRRLLRRHPIVHCALVANVDRRRGEVRVRGRRSLITQLPETLPLVL